MLINYQFAGETLAGYPKLSRYLEGLWKRPSFQQQFAQELPAAEQIEGMDLTVLRKALH